MKPCPASKSLHYAKEVEKLITATEELSLGPEENELVVLSAGGGDDDLHLSQQPAVPGGEDESPVGEGGLDETDRSALPEEPNLIVAIQSPGRDSLAGQPARENVSTTEYLPFMLHVHSPAGILPRYPSWSLVCLGSSSLYSHNSGLADQPGFLTGSAFLLPWDVAVRVQPTNEDGRRPYSAVG